MTLYSNLYDYDIEQVISFQAFAKITGIDTADTEQIKAFIDELTLLQLNKVTPDSNGDWFDGAQEFFQKIQQELATDDKALSRTICLNETKGNVLFRTESNYRVLLFMICKDTEVLGQFLTDADFAILYFKIKVESEESTTDDGDDVKMSDPVSGNGGLTKAELKMKSELDAKNEIILKS